MTGFPLQSGLLENPF